VSDVINRDELERRLARLISREQRDELAELMRLLGDPPQLGNVPEEFWLNGGKQLRGVVVPVFQEIYLQQARELLQQFTVGVDWALVNQGAVDWSSRYAFDLVRGITDRTRAGLSDAVGAYYRDGLTIGDLEGMISQYFGPVRAEMIAVTEVTRAATEGERAVVREIERDNSSIQMVPVWQTNADDLVCEICGPRHDQEITDEFYPPAHPRCRCWTNHEMRVRA
jgi:hypothetical protein